jgi:hypothetical protein
LPVLIFCFTWSSFGVDDSIVHKDGEPSFLYLLSEYGVHHHLECCQ